MCILHRSFHALPALEKDAEVYTVSAAVRQELAILAALAPLMTTDMHAELVGEVVCSDASSKRIAAVVADVPTEAAREVWRRRELRGHYTRLCTSALEFVRAHRKMEERSWIADLEEEGLPEPKAPPWQLIERFDFIEVCCGPEASLSHAHMEENLVVGPMIDLKLHPLWDLRSTRVVEWLIFVLTQRRVWHIHCAAPCTTFSVARFPRLRSRQQPLGFDPHEEKTQCGNVLLLRTLLLLLVALKAGSHGSHEHPSGAFSWWVPQVQRMFARTGCEVVRFSACQFGAPYRKDTSLGLVRGEHLRPLGRMCNHRGAHAQPLKGARTTAAAAYSGQLCREWAALAAAQRALEGEWGADDDGPPPGPEGGRLEQGFVNELVGSAAWRVVMNAPCEGEHHINVLEVRAALRAMEGRARSRPGSRQAYLLDSAVGIGCLAKGRSSSLALNAELLRGLPPLLAYNHYPGVDFVPTRLNPSDDPTRDRSLRGPRCAIPFWLKRAQQGQCEDMLRWAALPRQRRQFSEWARLVFKLWTLWPLRDFDSTLGFPGEGPRPRRGQQAVVRPVVDLQAVRRLTPYTLERRRTLVRRFVIWLESLCPPIALWQLLEMPPRIIGKVLAAYGQVLFHTNGHIGAYLETINGVVDMDRSLQRQLPAAWDVASSWQDLEPTLHRIPTPRILMQALVGLAFLWGWWDVGVIIYVSFVAMLRPGEACRLTCSDLLLPTRLMLDTPTMYVKLKEPKGRWAVARMEHVRVDEEMLIVFLEAWVLGWPARRRLFQGSYSTFRKLHDALVRFFGISVEEGIGITPGSHRGGGATFLFQELEDLGKTQWRGRWRQLRTLEVYVQEVAAVSLLPELDVLARERIRRFGAAAPGILQAATRSLRLGKV